MKLSKDDKYYEIKLSTLNREKSEFFETAENIHKKKMTLLKRFTKKNKFKNVFCFKI